MTDPISKVSSRLLSPAELEARAHDTPACLQPGTSGPSFEKVLQSKVGGADGQLRFSTHAQSRLRSRAIELTPQDEAELGRAVEMAQRKGAQESLILLDDLALIVSIPNKTVITAMERQGDRASVFTHIDSAVVFNRGRTDAAA